MKKYILFSLFFFTLIDLQGMGAGMEIIRMKSLEIEEMFIRQNLSLIAGRYEIDMADAGIIQAKVWENPVLTIDQINLWSTSGQRDGEVIPPLFGSFGKNTEFTVELSQLILTANKRNKLIGREKVAKEITISEFEELLRTIRLELRQSMAEIIYYQSFLSILENQRNILEGVAEAYRKQSAVGNVSGTEVLRLQSAVLEIDNEMVEVKTDYYAAQKFLKALLNIDTYYTIYIEEDSKTYRDPEDLNLVELVNSSLESRPDLRALHLQTLYGQKSLSYEKSLRVPDVTVNASYDRYGGVWKDFVGFGVSIDLPFFNRNQGNIRMARIMTEQAAVNTRGQQNLVRQEVIESYYNYESAYRFYSKIQSQDNVLSQLDEMMDNYTKNLLNRNISMLEYMDFTDTYRTNKQIILNAKKNLDIQWEELQTITASEIK